MGNKEQMKSWKFYSAPTSSICELHREFDEKNCAISSHLGFSPPFTARFLLFFPSCSLSLDPVQKRYENEIQNCTNTSMRDLLEIRSFAYILSVSFWIAASALAKMHFVQNFYLFFFFTIPFFSLEKNLTLIAEIFHSKTRSLTEKCIKMSFDDFLLISERTIFMISQRWKKRKSYHFDVVFKSDSFGWW